MTDTDYPAMIKMQCYVGNSKMGGGGNAGFGAAPPAGAKAPRDLALAIWPDVLKEKVPPAVLRTIADTFTLSVDPALRKVTFDAIYTPWQQADPDNVEILTYKGKFYMHYAWDARGVDVGNKVTPEGERLFSERLDIAEQALTKAWAKDHNAADAATAMLTVELGQGQGRNRMEMWFKRAMEANPDNIDACTAKMYYLEPKWYGKSADMIAFARECVAGQNWHGTIPLMMQVAYGSLLAYVEDTDAFYGTPVVWNDIESCCVPYLRANPSDAWVRCKYTHFACLAGKWAVAQQQFTLLGKNLYSERFGGREAMQKFQALAREKGAAAPAP